MHELVGNSTSASQIYIKLLAKLKTMWEVLQKEGFSLEELNQIHAPIGLSIKSQTPEEIAVSVAAEIIRVKNELL